MQCNHIEMLSCCVNVIVNTRCETEIPAEIQMNSKFGIEI